MSQFEVYVGIDWGASEDFICIQDCQGQTLGERRVKSFQDMLKFIDETRGDVERSRVGCAIERTDLSIVAGLVHAKFPVFSINPKAVDRFRDRFCMSGAKDDRRDAEVLSSTLRTDSKAYHLYEPLSDNAGMLRGVFRARGQVVRRHREAANQLGAEIQRVYPGLNTLCPGADSLWFLNILEVVVTGDIAGIDEVMRKSSVRKVKAVDVRKALKTEHPPNQETKDVLRMVVEPTLALLKLTSAQIKSFNKTLEATLIAMAEEDGPTSDVVLLRSMPGFGPLVTSVFLTDLAKSVRERDRQQLRTLSGIAPVTKQSGKMKLVSQRRACIRDAQQMMFHAATYAANTDERFKSIYVAARARGHSRGRALRTVGDSMLRVLIAVLKTKKKYCAKFKTSPC